CEKSRSLRQSLSAPIAGATVFLIGCLGGQAVDQIHSFGTGPYHGGYSGAPVVQGPDGALYGTMSSGGSNDYGVVFKLNTNGSDYTVLRAFGGNGDGQSVGAVVQGWDGALYGTTGQGGTNG